MAQLKFQNLSFDEEKDMVFVTLMRLFEFSIPKKELDDAGVRKIGRNSIETDNPGKFNNLISKYIPGLKSKITGRKAVYIHKNSGIPLMGTLYFGIVDKGSDMIEIKPITGCNIDCIFCSVGEGKSAKKETDYVVEDDYIAEELEKLMQFKSKHQKDLKLKIFINPHGEPLLYTNMDQLVEKISKIKGVKTISIITNGLLLSNDLIDRLEEAGLTQLNLSINSFEQKKARMLSGSDSYSAEHMKSTAEYAAKKLKLVIAPVWIKGTNDEDIEEMIRFAKKHKEHGCKVGIQKFISHKRGKKPIKEVSWDEFYRKIEEWEKKHDISLRYCEEISKTKELPMPFRRNDKVSARVVCSGRKKAEMIASARGRCIVVHDCTKKPGETVKIRLKIAKNNVFVGEMV